MNLENFKYKQNDGIDFRNTSDGKIRLNNNVVEILHLIICDSSKEHFISFSGLIDQKSDITQFKLGTSILPEKLNSDSIKCSFDSTLNIITIKNPQIFMKYEIEYTVNIQKTIEDLTDTIVGLTDRIYDLERYNRQ